VTDAGHDNARLFSTVGLLSATMPCALLLTVTGRSRHIEDALDERTADLRREAAEHRHGESALRASEERFRNIFDHAPIGIVYADLQGRMRDANPRLRNMIGDAGQALSERSLTALTHPDDRAEDAQGLARLLAGELPEFKRNSRLMHRNGQMLSARMNWSVLRGADGLPQRLVAVVEDITEHLRRQDAGRGRQAAEPANLAKSAFLSRMSHELRTLLNAMLGFAQLLDLDTRPALAPHQRTWAAQILQSGWHLLEMINDTLVLSHIDAGMLRMVLAPVPLQALVQQCVGMMEPAAARRSISLQVQLDDAALRVVGDETQLSQVLINLLSNAVKYNLPGGRVLVQRARPVAGTVTLRVHDTGPGLTDVQMANLFQPFNWLVREQGDIEGTGIGLVIRRRLAELMGGTLQAEPNAGQGATVVLTLPVAPPAARPDPAGHEPARRGRAGTAAPAAARPGLRQDPGGGGVGRRHAGPHRGRPGRRRPPLHDQTAEPRHLPGHARRVARRHRQPVWVGAQGRSALRLGRRSILGGLLGCGIARRASGLVGRGHRAEGRAGHRQPVLRQPGRAAGAHARDTFDQVAPALEAALLAGAEDLARQRRADALDGFELGGTGPVDVGSRGDLGSQQGQGGEQGGDQGTDHGELLGNGGWLG
jgi:PAS domain S-box-containing protein